MGQPITRITAPMLSVLGALANGESSYGLRIAEAAGVRTGVVYPILARFERAGWVAGSFGEDQDGAQRKYYRLTPQGRESARAALRLAKRSGI